MVLIERLRCEWLVEIDVLCDPISCYQMDRVVGEGGVHMPDPYTKIDPASIFFPAFCGNGVQLHEKIRGTHLLVLCA